MEGQMNIIIIWEQKNTMAKGIRLRYLFVTHSGAILSMLNEYVTFRMNQSHDLVMESNWPCKSQHAQ